MSTTVKCNDYALILRFAKSPSQSTATPEEAKRYRLLQLNNALPLQSKKGLPYYTPASFHTLSHVIRAKAKLVLIRFLDSTNLLIVIALIKKLGYLLRFHLKPIRFC